MAKFWRLSYIEYLSVWDKNVHYLPPSPKVVIHVISFDNWKLTIRQTHKTCPTAYFPSSYYFRRDFYDSLILISWITPYMGTIVKILVKQLTVLLVQILHSRAGMGRHPTDLLRQFQYCWPNHSGNCFACNVAVNLRGVPILIEDSRHVQFRLEL